MKRIISHTILIPSLLLVVLMQFGQVKFSHTHLASDGKVYSHAHPYKVADNNSESKPIPHKHTKKEFLILQGIDSDFNPLLQAPIKLEHKTQNFDIKTCTFIYEVYFPTSLKGVKFRGPPQA